MKNQEKPSYLFVIYDRACPIEILNAESFKSAIEELSKHDDLVCSLDLFRKCLKGFDENDVDGVISLFEYFSDCKITSVYSSNEFCFWKRKESEG